MRRPLADLHRHLDGSLRRSTLEELAERLGVEVPDDLGFFPGMGLEAALACFELTLSVLQTPDAVARVAGEMCEDAAAEGVTTLEIRFAPQLHRGAPMEEIVDAALAGCDGRAGLLLCGLYGDPPSFYDRFLEIAEDRPGVVGIDLAGGPQPSSSEVSPRAGFRRPELDPSPRRVDSRELDSRSRVSGVKATPWRMEDYAPAFRRARESGLGCTVHAGECRPAAEIGQAIEVLGAQRIGHGTTLLDDARVLDLVLERGVTIEACLTSNLHTGAVPELAEHPLPRWLELGVSACLNADNTLFSATDAREESARALALPGMTDERLSEVIAHGHRAAFRR